MRLVFALAFSAIQFLAAIELCFAQPKVVVFPFRAVMDSLYQWEGKTSILDYREALREMISTELAQGVTHSEEDLSGEIVRRELVTVIEPSALDEQLAKKEWKSGEDAATIAAELGADYAVIGTYGEYSREIRVDARVVVVAQQTVPAGYSVSATVGLWEDLPSAANKIAQKILPLITASGRLRPVSAANLYPEGELSDYSARPAPAGDVARLVIWTNAPAPEITVSSGEKFVRCERIDLVNTPPEKQRSHSCRSALLSAGTVTISVAHRGYVPYRDTLTLAAGKAYRLEVRLEEVKVETR